MTKTNSFLTIVRLVKFNLKVFVVNDAFWFYCTPQKNNLFLNNMSYSNLTKSISLTFRKQIIYISRG